MYNSIKLGRGGRIFVKAKVKGSAPEVRMCTRFTRGVWQRSAVSILTPSRTGKRIFGLALHGKSRATTQITAIVNHPIAVWMGGGRQHISNNTHTHTNALSLMKSTRHAATKSQITFRSRRRPGSWWRMSFFLQVGCLRSLLNTSTDKTNEVAVAKRLTLVVLTIQTRRPGHTRNLLKW